MKHRRSLFIVGAGVTLALATVQLATTTGAGAAPAPGMTAAMAPMGAPLGQWIDAPPEDQVHGVVPSTAVPDQSPTHHEFQANCSVTHTRPDDPIVYPGQSGASHDHTFLGNPTVDANSTVASLRAGTTTCKVPEDKSGYWMPTMLDGTKSVLPVGLQVIYYKSGVFDYTSVRPFPIGLRYVVGSVSATTDEFKNAPGAVEATSAATAAATTTSPP